MFKYYFVPLLGCCFEYFDFMLYIHMAPIISKKFFPANNPELVQVIVLVIAFVSRPFGGLVLSHFSDKYSRLKVLQVAGFVMGFCSLFLSFLPTYASIGYFATVAVILLRLMQGFSAGGEIPSAISYIVERTQEKRKGLMASVVFFSFICGSVLAFGIASYVICHMDIPFWAQYGWRIPFLVGGFLFFISFYLRIQIREKNLNKSLALYIKYPAIEVVKKFKLNLLYSFLFYFLVSLFMFLIFVNMTSFANKRLTLPKEDLSIINNIFYFLVPLLTVFFGWLNSRINEYILYFMGSCLFIVTNFLLLTVVQVQNLTTVILMYCLLSISAAFVCGSNYIIAYRMFPRHVRSTGIAIVSSMSTMLAGSCGTIILHNFMESFFGVNLVFVILFVYAILVTPILMYKFLWKKSKNENIAVAVKST